MHIIKPGSIVTDIGTGSKGMITHVNIEMGGVAFYAFQPRGLNKETLQPAERTWLVEGRFAGGERIPLPDVVDLSILGTEVEDEASGFSGKAVSLCYHISGCVHVAVQPQGTHPKHGGRIEPHDFDLRRLKGKAIKPMTEQEREQSQRERPSPSDTPKRPVG